MKRKLLIALTSVFVFVGVICTWRVAYSLRKSNDNLPTLTMIAEMSEPEVNSLLPGYKIVQLTEVWGEPDYSEENEARWQIGNMILFVNYKNNGVVAICGLKEEIKPTYKVDVTGDYQLENSLKDTYEAGEQVTIKLATITEHYYVVYANSVEQPMDMDTSDLTYTYFTFTMPAEDVSVEIEGVYVDIPYISYALTLTEVAELVEQGETVSFVCMTREAVHGYWGQPDAEAHGFFGDIYHVPGTYESIIFRYDESDIVENVSIEYRN